MTNSASSIAPTKNNGPANSGAVLEFRNVSIGFDHPVLQDVSFSVGPDETRILLGPAGVGKSVLLKLANGLLSPDAGSIHLFGEDISDMPEQQLFHLRTRTGMVFQEGALFDSLTVRDNVAYQLIQEEAPDEEINSRVREALRFVGLEQTFSLFPGSLSGGMRRRVAIARALIHTPHLLLYDSPTGGLDPVTSTTIIELIVKQRDVYRTPSVLVTHRLQDAFTMCSHRFEPSEDRMVPLPKDQTDPNTTFLMLNEGHLIFDGSLHQLVSSQDPFVREFIE
ncbi:MAG: ATP-binding cassette domain-containing protein [Terracidiphilus sp.]